jgi:hypothetical protein
MTIAEAAQWMNVHAWYMVPPKIVFVSGGRVGINQYSPFQVLAAHNASCTGLSEFLVACLRTVGIPARIAGTPHWNLPRAVCPHGDASAACGNHDWVEVWAGGAWAFVDEDGDRRLNRSWFFPGHSKHQRGGTFNHSIYATSWAPSAVMAAMFGGGDDPLAVPAPYFPMVWDWRDRISSAWDVTARYSSMIPRRNQTM